MTAVEDKLEREGSTLDRAPSSLRLTVVVPAWNASAILAPHLPRMVEEASLVHGGAEIVIVDDGSDPGDALAAVAAAGGPLVRLVSLAAHAGFAGACNAGAAAARGEAVLFLNTDMHVEPGCFEKLLAVLEPSPGTFAVTPVIVNLRGGFPESSTRLRFHRGVFDVVLPGRTGELAPAPGELRSIAFGCGGALMCRRVAFRALRGFSDLFAPIYWDDVDLSWRARRSGMTIVEVGGARILHDHARTVGAQVRPGRLRAISERNRVLFTWLHLTGARSWATHVLWFLPRLAAAAARRDAAARGMLAAFGAAARLARERRRMTDDGVAVRALFSLVRRGGEAGWPVAGTPTGA